MGGSLIVLVRLTEGRVAMYPRLASRADMLLQNVSDTSKKASKFPTCLVAEFQPCGLMQTQILIAVCTPFGLMNRPHRSFSAPRTSSRSLPLQHHRTWASHRRSHNHHSFPQD